MPDVTRIYFSHVATIQVMLRPHDIRSGIWGLLIEAKYRGDNFTLDAAEKAVPGFLMTIEQMALQRMDQHVPGLTVDAATLVWPSGGEGSYDNESSGSIA